MDHVYVVFEGIKLTKWVVFVGEICPEINEHGLLFSYY